MTTPNNAFRVPGPTDAPDGPGAIFNLATDVDNLIVSAGLWTPALGGGSGASIGTGGTVSGKYLRIGKHINAKGRIVFGTGASFGAGNATIAGLPGSIDSTLSSGYGTYYTTAAPTFGNPVLFSGTDGANLVIRAIVSQPSGSLTNFAGGSSLGTPAANSMLIFALDLVLA
jgi:hypothetical protein